VVLWGCGKLRGSTSCEVWFFTSLQPDKNLYVCVCVGPTSRAQLWTFYKHLVIRTVPAVERHRTSWVMLTLRTMTMMMTSSRHWQPYHHHHHHHHHCQQLSPSCPVHVTVSKDVNSIIYVAYQLPSRALSCAMLCHCYVGAAETARIETGCCNGNCETRWHGVTVTFQLRADMCVFAEFILLHSFCSCI